MPASNLLALIDDIATTLDDVAAMTKVATKKTAGVLGDDLALNAKQLTGFHTDRELPLVWAVAKGSAVNKAILIPIALMISQLTPWLVSPLLMAGGLFLCFEGFEKVFEKITKAFFKKTKDGSAWQGTGQKSVPLDEKTRVRGAIRTDFILSAEIIVISLGSIAQAPLIQQFSVLVGISALMTVGVYGLVALIVRLDDFGLFLVQRTPRRITQELGNCILWFAPWLMRFLGVTGTLAMFLVGGGILVHGVPLFHHWDESLTPIPRFFFGMSVGFCSGAITALFVHWTAKIRGKRATT